MANATEKYSAGISSARVTGAARAGRAGRQDPLTAMTRRGNKPASQQGARGRKQGGYGEESDPRGRGRAGQGRAGERRKVESVRKISRGRRAERAERRRILIGRLVLLVLYYLQSGRGRGGGGAARHSEA